MAEGQGLAISYNLLNNNDLIENFCFKYPHICPLIQGFDFRHLISPRAFFAI